MSDLDNILGNSNKDIDNQKLMDYLAGKLSDEEQHEIERMMQESEMTDDALEGLQGVENKARLDLVTFDIDRKLKQHLKTNRKDKRKITNFNLTVIAIVLILLLCILGYIVIRMYNRP